MNAKHQELLDAIEAVRQTVEILKASGVGRLAMTGALAHVLNLVIEAGPDADDCNSLRDLYATALAEGKC